MKLFILAIAVTLLGCGAAYAGGDGGGKPQDGPKGKRCGLLEASSSLAGIEGNKRTHVFLLAGGDGGGPKSSTLGQGGNG